jgi:CTP:molybdopterin cytidylyltransferase MocA
MDTSPDVSLHAAILAAGPSSRFGSPKQLVRLSGAPVLHRAHRQRRVSSSGSPVTVILGANAREVASALRQSAVTTVVNRDWSEGIASSIRLAVQSAPSRSSALLLLLADQVGITADDLKRLHAAWHRHPIQIAASLYGGAPGLPAIFPSWAFGDLTSLRGDADPRLVIRRSIDRVVRVAMPNAAIDLNTPEDLLEFDQHDPVRADL